MNAEKSQAYKKLVADMQEKYPVYGGKVAVNFSGKIGSKANQDAKKIVQDFAATFSNKQDFYDALKKMGFEWMQVDNPAIYEMRAKERLRLAVQDGFDPFNVVTKKDPPVELFAPVLNGEMLCQEINFYTYWQGLGYAENTPKIKYLLVAQDWGNLNLTQDFIDKIKNLNAGDKTPLYFEKPSGIGTDQNLFELFKIIGYDLTKRHDDLFFTNFCLGYRPPNSKSVGGMTKKLMLNDKEEFKRLCDILEPEKILCLGQFTFESVYESLTGKNYSVSGGYNNFIEKHEIFIARCGNVESQIFPLAHCGYMGTMNRNKNLPKQDDILFYQKQDWKKIAGLKTTEFTRKFLSNKFLTKKFFKDARFIHVSASGAMGDAGVAEVWTKNFEHYRCYWPGVLNIDKFCKFFMRETDCPYFDLPAKDGWSSHYMGCGHNFYIKEELNEVYLKKFNEAQKNGAGYMIDNDIPPIEEIMLEILNESPENNFSPTEKDLVEMGRNLESAINKFDLEDNIIIYRRAEIALLNYFEKIFQAGGIFQDDGFTSCTALKIGSTENDIEIVVLVPKGKGYGAYIAPLSAFPEECEFVLNHGTIFKIRSIEEYEPKNFRVVVEVIGRNPKELF